MLVAAEWVAANGDSAAVLGSRAIGQLAAARRTATGAAGPRLLVSSLAAAIDPDCPGGAAIPADLPRAAGQPDPRALPASDVISADHISALVTERGFLVPATPSALASLVGAAPRSDAHAVVSD